MTPIEVTGQSDILETLQRLAQTIKDMQATLARFDERITDLEWAVSTIESEIE